MKNTGLLSQSPNKLNPKHATFLSPLVQILCPGEQAVLWPPSDIVLTRSEASGSTQTARHTERLPPPPPRGPVCGHGHVIQPLTIPICNSAF